MSKQLQSGRARVENKNTTSGFRFCGGPRCQVSRPVQVSITDIIVYFVRQQRYAIKRAPLHTVIVEHLHKLFTLMKRANTVIYYIESLGSQTHQIWSI